MVVAVYRVCPSRSPMLTGAPWTSTPSSRYIYTGSYVGRHYNYTRPTQYQCQFMTHFVSVCVHVCHAMMCLSLARLLLQGCDRIWGIQRDDQAEEMDPACQRGKHCTLHYSCLISLSLSMYLSSLTRSHTHTHSPSLPPSLPPPPPPLSLSAGL